MTNILTFNIFNRPDGRLALEAVVNGVASGYYLHWIEVTTGEACWSSRGDICYSFESEAQALAILADLEKKALTGKLFKRITHKQIDSPVTLWKSIC